MTLAYVDLYEPEMEPVRGIVERLDVTEINAFAAETAKKIADEIGDKLWSAIEGHLTGDLSYNVSARASEIAGRYIAEALSGDDVKLRKIFGLWNEYKPDEWLLTQPGSYRPGAWELLRALCEKFPDLLQSELVKQQETEIAALRNEVAKLRTRVDQLIREQV